MKIGVTFAIERGNMLYGFSHRMPLCSRLESSDSCHDQVEARAWAAWFWLTRRIGRIPMRTYLGTYIRKESHSEVQSFGVFVSKAEVKYFLSTAITIIGMDFSRLLIFSACGGSYSAWRMCMPLYHE